MKQGGPLSHITVIELGSFIAGPYCGQILGDLGATVIKVEPPGTGDLMRQWGVSKAPNGKSLWWPVISRNKKSVTLDLRRESGQKIARRLIANADVVVENFRPGTLDRWNLSSESLRAENPGLIVASISGFGQDGPNAKRAGFAAIAEAAAGLRTLTGYPDRPSTRVGISIGDSLAGLFAAIGVLSSLIARGENSGAGQNVDVAITEAVLAVMESTISEFAATGINRERSGSVLPGIAPSNVYPTADNREVIIAANADGLFKRLASLMGRGDMVDDPRFCTHHARGTNQAVLDEIVAAWSTTIPHDALLGKLFDAGIPAGPVNTAADVVADSHFRARKAIVDIEDKDLGTLTMQGLVPQLSKTPGAIKWTGPDLGQHTHDVLSNMLSMSESEISKLTVQGVI
jgi:formyl-CoA transferase/succinyl-CoA--D-citramalate CoA-transferase